MGAVITGFFNSLRLGIEPNLYFLSVNRNLGMMLGVMIDV